MNLHKAREKEKEREVVFAKDSSWTFLLYIIFPPFLNDLLIS